MCCKNEYFILSPITYIKRFKSKIFLYNTVSRKKEIILEPLIIDEITSKLNLYNSSFLINKKFREVYENLVSLGLGEIKLSDKALFVPLKSCIKVENTKEIIQKENNLVLSKQVQNNIIELSFILNEFFNKSPLERQYLFGEYKGGYKDILEQIHYFSSNRDLFRNLQSINIYVSSIEELNLSKNVLGEIDIVRFHIPIDLYLSSISTFKDLKTTIYLKNNTEFDDIGVLFENHKYVLFINDIDSLVPYNNSIAYKPIVNNNIEFLNNNVFLNENEITDRELSVHDIVQNSIINYHDFGKIFIDINGQFGTNLFSKKLGSFFENNMKDNFMKCYNSNNSTWFLTRSQVEPCLNCNYCDLCPPISGLEFLIDQYDVCCNIE